MVWCGFPSERNFRRLPKCLVSSDNGHQHENRNKTPADIELVVESVQENPSDQILKEDEIHWWVVLDKNGNRASSLSRNIASAAATTSRRVEDLLMDGYSFQKVAITITPVFTLRGEYEKG